MPKFSSVCVFVAYSKQKERASLLSLLCKRVSAAVLMRMNDRARHRQRENITCIPHVIYSLLAFILHTCIRTHKSYVHIYTYVQRTKVSKTEFAFCIMKRFEQVNFYIYLFCVRNKTYSQLRFSLSHFLENFPFFISIYKFHFIYVICLDVCVCALETEVCFSETSRTKNSRNTFLRTYVRMESCWRDVQRLLLT